jgi:hypothetical protein
MKPRRQPRLVEEHLDELVLAREVRMETLDRDEALKPADATEAREKNGRHPTACQLGDELEPVETLDLSFVREKLRQGLRPPPAIKPPFIVERSIPGTSGSASERTGEPYMGSTRHGRDRR